MVKLTQEELNPSFIENTTMMKVIRDGAHFLYRIQPNEGYVLHDKAGDFADPDEVEQKAYFGLSCSCAADYDFMPVTMTVPDREGNPITVTAYGDREFYAIPEGFVPADHIFGAK